MRRIAILLCSVVVTAMACKPEAPPEPPSGVSAPTVVEPAPAAVDDARGGRIFDKWWVELEREFQPGKMGGPNADGTLDAGTGEPMPNPGHDYRFKNLFGWDLRGADGVYGPEYQDRPYVASVNLLTDTRSREELLAWLQAGDDVVPAFGAVLSHDELYALVDFIDGVRTGALPSPAQVFDLSKDAPKNYVLRPGADTTRGAKLFADSCGCHGGDGTSFAVDPDVSTGAFMRTKGYEAWIKILNGHPGTPMHREIEFETAEDGAQQILDIIAALCDRAAYPPMPGIEDVPDGDIRCGAYLK
ncbi:MAG: hypothetical protein AAF721_33110 [Myxococcota bacterium]